MKNLLFLFLILPILGFSQKKHDYIVKSTKDTVYCTNIHKTSYGLQYNLINKNKKLVSTKYDYVRSFKKGKHIYDVRYL